MISEDMTNAASKLRMANVLSELNEVALGLINYYLPHLEDRRSRSTIQLVLNGSVCRGETDGRSATQ